MRRLIRIFVAVTAGAALAYFITTPNGRAFRTRAADLMRRCYTTSDCSCDGCGPEEADSSSGSSHSMDSAVKAKIDETRRRLRKQLKETLEPTLPGGTDQPPTQTMA